MLRVKSRKFIRAAALALVVAFTAAVPTVFVPETAVAANSSVKITLDYRQTEARSQLAQINSWRAGNTWYYNSSGVKLYLNGLKALKYDYTLEKYAMQRAAEIALSFEHTRPNNSTRSGLSGYLGTGENIAATTNSQGATATYALTMFKEEDKPYSGQGHRRMMLSVPADFDCVGIACVYYKGCYYWAQEFGVTSKPDTTATTAVNGNKTMTVEVDPTVLTSKSADLSALNNWQAKLNKGETDYLPEITLNLGTSETWPYVSIPVAAVPTWTSSNAGVASVNSGTGTVTGVSAGTANVTASEGLTGTKKTVSVTVTDPNAVTGVTLNNSTLALNTGASSTLTAAVLPSSTANKSVTWSSSNTAVATVSSSGVVKGIKAGTATITVRTVSGGKTAACRVTVSDVIPTSVTLDKTSLTLGAGESQTLNASISPLAATNKSVIWSSSNTAVATVKDGVVRGVSAGTAVITARTESGAKTATCRATVTQPVTGVSLNRSSLTLLPGNNSALSAVVSPGNATNKTLTWNSSNKSVATVDQNGNVKAVAPGLSRITVTTKDGNKTASCNVRVHFLDVTSTGSWYYKAVYWASDNGIATGSNGYFSPDSDCTREQAVTFLWRMQGKPEPKSMVSKFADVTNPSSYSYKAILWASENNIVTGSNGRFQPKGKCTREMIVTIIWRLAGRPAPKSLTSGFSDVKNKNSYSYKGILWANENGIATGTNGRFSPTSNCKRRDIVTFLYRYKN